MFLHGGIIHLAGNVLFLWIFGDNLEEAMGRLGFLTFYLACGIGAGLAQVLVDPLSTVPVIGASGAIAGVMGGYLLLYPRAQVDILVILIVFLRIIALPAWAMLGIWFVFQLVNGSVNDSTGGGVAYWAHAGGFILGVLFCLPVWLRRGAQDSWHKNRGRPAHAPAIYSFRKTTIPRVRRRPSRSDRTKGPWDQ
jgi:membrane associated rhomboid family serine protease